MTLDSKSLDELTELAKQSDIEACYASARKYSKCPKTKKNIAKTIRWFLAASNKGHMEAHYRLGEYYLALDDERLLTVAIDHIGMAAVRAKNTAAIKLCIKFANEGHADASFKLGMLYNSLTETEDNAFAESVKWYRLAANQGYQEDQNMWKIIFDNGRSLPRNEKEALDWCTEQAERGDANAQYYLGEKYFLRKTMKIACEWLKKAADQGHAGAQYRLGWREIKNTDLLLEYYKKAAKQGHLQAQRALASFYELKDEKESLKWNRRAAEAGDVEAQVSLGRGGLWAQNNAEAFSWFSTAAASGSDEAWNCIFNMYQEDQIPDANEDDVFVWLVLAADYGNKDALARLGT